MAATPEPIKQKYKRAFLKGLGTLLPTILTAYILLWTYNFVDENVASPLNNVIKTQLRTTETGRDVATRWFELDPELLKAGNEEKLAKAIDQKFPSWVGLAAAIVIVFFVGFFVAGFLGRRLWYAFEFWLTRLPVIKSIYPSAKQIVDFFVQQEEDKLKFSRVVLAPFPSRTQLSVAFVMSQGTRDVERAHPEKRFLNIFIPMSPTPVTGFVVFVPEDECFPCDMSVDEALKYYLTCGLAVPQRLVPSKDGPPGLAAVAGAPGGGGAAAAAAAAAEPPSPARRGKGAAASATAAAISIARPRDGQDGGAKTAPKGQVTP